LGELALANAINYAKQNKITTLIISHRPSILTLVDKILIMKDGEVASMGDKDVVIKEINQSARPVMADLTNKKLN